MLQRLLAWMGAERVDGAFLTNPVSIAYLTGFRAEPHERLMALAVRQETVLIVPALEVESASATARGVGVEVRGWQDGEDPFLTVAEALGPAAGRLAVEKSHLTLAGYEALRESVGTRELVDAGPAIRRMRAVKTPQELERLARAAEITDQVTDAVLAEVEPGMSELDVAARLAALIGSADAQLSFDSLVQSGPNSAQPHLRPTGRRLATGEVLLLDFGAACDGYRADTTRTAILGKPDARQREVHRVVLEAHDRALAAVRAGVAAGNVDQAARTVIRAAGLAEFFIHRTGHGLGLEAHEAPSLDPGSHVALEEGMVITIEPGVYLPGWAGVRIEDDVVVERDGARVLTQAGRELLSL